MKKLILSLMLAAVLPASLFAQDDDMYFVPSKSTDVYERPLPPPVFHGGIPRSVDDYNRRGHFRSSYRPIKADSLMADSLVDVIDFNIGDGLYPDSLALDSFLTFYQSDVYELDDDYQYSRRMSRFDDYYPYGGYYGAIGYYDWYDPWTYPWYYGRWGYYRPYWYAGWGWYDPWYYGWGYPYYRYGWGRPYWGYGGHVAYRHGAGTRNHGRVTGRYQGGAQGGGVRGNRGRFGNSRVGSGTYSNPGTRSGSPTRTTPSNPGNFGGSRSINGGNFGGTHSGGSFGGGSHVSGGGFGGGSRGGGGGGHFGGRR